MVISTSNSWNIRKWGEGGEAATSSIQVSFCSSKTQHWRTRASVHSIEIVAGWGGGEGEGMSAATAEVLRLAVNVISAGKSNGLLKSKLEAEVLLPNRANGSPVLDAKGLNTVFDM